MTPHVSFSVVPPTKSIVAMFTFLVLGLQRNKHIHTSSVGRSGGLASPWLSPWRCTSAHKWAVHQRPCIEGWGSLGCLQRYCPALTGQTLAGLDTVFLHIKHRQLMYCTCCVAYHDTTFWAPACSKRGRSLGPSLWDSLPGEQRTSLSWSGRTLLPGRKLSDPAPPRLQLVGLPQAYQEEEPW